MVKHKQGGKNQYFTILHGEGWRTAKRMAIHVQYV